MSAPGDFDPTNAMIGALEAQTTAYQAATEAILGSLGLVLGNPDTQQGPAAERLAGISQRLLDAAHAIGSAIGPEIVALDKEPPVTEPEEIIKVALDDGPNAFIDRARVPLLSYHKPILHALTLIGHDRATGEDIHAIADAITPYPLPQARDVTIATEQLAGRIKDVGIDLIDIVQDDGIDGHLSKRTRFGIADGMTLELVSNAEQPLSSPNVPRLTPSGIIEGSLSDGIIDLRENPRAIPSTHNPIDLLILSNDLAYIRGKNGHTVRLGARRLVLANILLTQQEAITTSQIRDLLAATSNDDKLLQDNISRVMMELARDLGQTLDGRDLLIRKRIYQSDGTYLFHQDLNVHDLRKFAQTSEAA